ncbi:MAG: polyphosphate polymerase domain-containing protein [Candidatus Dadabacteria bacterium]|nr:MAG: polyphosphate polymerase domain-containing protein [Candidatus Dadabacteria bacterium]
MAALGAPGAVMIKKSKFRHELKYVIRLEDAHRFYEDISPFCDLDEHAGATKYYEIASTYYDTEDLRFYLDREESVGYRRKVRLRSYNSNGQSTALFIEIKERHKSYVSKKRANLKENDLLARYQRHDRIPLDEVIAVLEDGEVARELRYLHKRLELYPVVIIRYLRRAVIPHYERDMRITLDTRITSGGQSLPQYSPAEEKYLIDGGHGVLEIKTNQTIPLWLSSALTRYGVPQTRFSKYCLGLDKAFGKGRWWINCRESTPLEEFRKAAAVA